VGWGGVLSFLKDAAPPKSRTLSSWQLPYPKCSRGGDEATSGVVVIVCRDWARVFLPTLDGPTITTRFAEAAMVLGEFLQEIDCLLELEPRFVA
jgi:hypothetical protein